MKTSGHLFHQKQLHRAVKASIPILAMMGGGAFASVRSTSSSINGRRNTVVNVAGGQQHKKSTNTDSTTRVRNIRRSPFATFTGRKNSIAKTANIGIDKKALAFLKTNNLLNTGVNVAANLSGNILGRKLFSHTLPWTQNTADIACNNAPNRNFTYYGNSGTADTKVGCALFNTAGGLVSSNTLSQNVPNHNACQVIHDNCIHAAAAPTITAVTIPNTAMKVGDAVTVSITADAAGLTLVSGVVNGVAVTGFSDDGGGNYSATYTVTEGDTDRAIGDAIPVSFILEDGGGTDSNTFTTAITQNADSIDANSPSVTTVSIPNAAMNVGDVVTVSITASETGLSFVSGTINGVAVTGFSDDGGGAYSATYTVAEGHTDRATGDAIPVSFVLQDSAGNNSPTFTTAITQNADSIDANSPSVTTVSIPNTAMNIGDAVTVSIVASEAGLSFVSGTINGVSVTGFSDNGGGNYSATYTVAEGHTDQAIGDAIPVSLVLQDSSGNNSATFTTAITQNADSIDANSPTVTGISIPNTAMNVGDAVTVSITAGEAGLSLISGSVNGVAVTGFSDNGGGNYSATYTVAEGHTDRATGDAIPVSFVLQDGAGNNSATFSTAITQNADSIDANSPTVTAVSIPNTAMKVGDAVTVSITASEAGLSLTSGAINGVAVTGFSDNGGGNYSATYTVAEGNTNRAVGDSIPVSFVLQDGAGNNSNTFTTAITQNADSIDANSPSVTGVSIPNTAMNVGDAVTVSITASEAGLSLSSGTINGVAVTGFSDNGGGNYSATYTVAEGHTDRTAGNTIPVSFVVRDGAGNNSPTFSTAITQNADSIDANSPTITAVSIPNTAMKVGDAVTVSITAGEAGLSLISGSVNGVAVTGFSDNGGGNYSATYTVAEGHTDRATGDAIPVSFVLQDGAGNNSATFSTAITQNADSIDANSPTVTAVSIPNTAMKVGDVVTVSITASEAGLTLSSGTINGVAVTGFSDNGGGNYSATYTVVEGNTNRAVGDSIPVSFVLQDGAGNNSNTFATAISQNADSIDANSPSVTGVSIPNTAMNVGDAVTVSITASEAGLSLSSGTINGVAVTGFSDNGGGNYSATYTVAEGHTDRTAGNTIPVSFVLRDGAGNNSPTFSTAITQNADSIDANSPTVTGISIPNTAMKVGDAVTVSITAGEAGLSFVSGSINGVAVTGFSDNGGGNYSATYTVAEGNTNRAVGDSIPVSFVLQDGAGNNSNTFTTAISQNADSIDANSPTVTAVSIPNTAMKVGDVVTVSITASEAGLTLSSGTINAVAVTGFSDNGGGNYSATYTVAEGNTNRAVGDSIPVSFVLQDGAGNNSNTFTTAISQNADSIDANSPAVTAVSIPNTAMKVGDAVTVSITASEAGLTLSSGTINGVAITAYSDNGGGNYSATYTVAEGNTDRAIGDAIPVSIVLQDSVGNNSNTFTTAITQAADSIDANSPTVTAVTIPNTGMKIGDTVTVSITAGEAGLSLVSGSINGVAVTGFSDNGGGNYSATYTVAAGHTERAVGDSIPVSFVLSDSAGNNSATFSTAIVQNADSIDANSPTVTAVSIPNTAMKVGDAVTVSITASEAGLTLSSGTINAVAVTGFSDNGGGNYSATYTVAEGNTDRAIGDTIPVSFVLQDGAGNDSNTFSTAITENADSIDANSPTVTGVGIPNSPMKIGDAVTVSITASEAGLAFSSGTINGVVVTGFTDNGGGSYSATYTVAAGHTDRAIGDSIPVSFVLQDGAGNDSNTYTTAITQNADSIDATEPSVIDVSASSADGTYPMGSVIPINVQFNDIMDVTGTPQITLETGDTDAVVDYSSGTGTNTLGFNYTIASGHKNSDLSYLSTSALVLNGGTIADQAGNPAILTLVNPGNATSLSSNKNIDVDASLVINEVDYDQGAADSLEFIEIKNITGSSIDLSAYNLQLINSNGLSDYSTTALIGTLAANQYHVICADNSQVLHCDQDISPDLDLIIDGAPNAISLNKGTVILDAVSYEGDTPNGFTETSAAPADDGSTALVGLSRFADGTDSNDNSSDFSLKCVTPGGANNINANSVCFAVSINDPIAVIEGNTGSNTLNFTLSLSHAATSDVSVNYSTADNTATTADNDYSVLAGIATISAGSSNQSISVTVNGDTIDEAASETFFLNLTSSSANAIITDNQGIGTISDDDASPGTGGGGGTSIAPEISIEGNGIIISNGDNLPSLTDHSKFSDTLIGVSSIRTFKIKNIGNDSLSVDSIIISGANSAEFEIITLPQSTIDSSSGFSDFQIAFKPEGLGLRTAIVSISNTDSDENPFSFTITGLGTEVEQPTTGNQDSDGDGIIDSIEILQGTDPLVKDNDVLGNERFFVMQLYRDFIFREGEEAGIAHWQTLFNSMAGNRNQVVIGFSRSTEVADKIVPIIRLYFSYFKRLPDLDGLKYWVGLMQDESSLAGISEKFATSLEFYETYGQLDNSSFVQLVYQNVFGRDADTEGLNHWLTELANGNVSRGQLMLDFSESLEFKNLSDVSSQILLLYVGLLGRMPDQAGVDFWIAQLNAGGSLLDIIDQFFQTDEYFQRFYE